jgi:hypothetical protein
MKQVMWFGVALAAGCGNGGSGGLSVEVSAPEAALAAYQDGDGAWIALPLDAAGTGRFTSEAGFYGVTVFCPDRELSGGTIFGSRMQTRYDTGAKTIASGCTIGQLDTVEVTGLTAPDAEVWFDGSPVVADETGTYRTFATAGTRDVFAIVRGEPSLVLVERDVDLTADRTLDLPVLTDGVAMTTITPVTSGADEPLLIADLNTADDDWVLLDESRTTLAVLPPELLAPGDRMTVSARASNCFAQMPADDPTLVIPAEMDATVNRFAATFAIDPTIVWEGVQARLRPEVPGLGRTMSVSASAEWLVESGALDTIPFVDATTIPGWTPELAGDFGSGNAVSANVNAFRGDFDGEMAGCNVISTFSW